MNRFRIICGDSNDVLDTLEAKSVDVIFTSPDPPENTGNIKHLLAIFDKCKRVLKDSGSLWVQIADQHDPDTGSMKLIPEWFVMAMAATWIVRGKLIWHRTENNPYQEDYTRFKRDWEYLFWFTKAKEAYFDYETPVWGHWSSVISLPYIPPREHEFASGFPEGLIEIALAKTAPPNSTVLDPFCDSGTTGIVALRMGHSFIGIEKDQDKIAKITKRLKTETKI